jgi:hypothetical protein
MSENHFSKCDHCGDAIAWHEAMCTTYTADDGLQHLIPGQYHSRCCDPARTKFLAGRDLGDTPEHLKPLLRAARETYPSAVIADDHDDSPGVWPPGGNGLFCEIDLTAERLRTRFACGATLSRQMLRGYIEHGSCYPTADARRIGREEFGMSFGEDEEEDLGECANCGEPFKRFAVTVLKNGAHYCTTACSLRQPESPDDLNAAIHASFKTGTEGIPRPQPTRALTSPIFAPSCACGATSNLKQIGVKFTNAYRAYGEFRCGPCEQSRRRAELQAAKIERLKGEMDRKVTPKWCEAPRGWPEGAGDDYEL